MYTAFHSDGSGDNITDLNNWWSCSHISLNSMRWERIILAHMSKSAHNSLIFFVNFQLDASWSNTPLLSTACILLRNKVFVYQPSHAAIMWSRDCQFFFVVARTLCRRSKSKKSLISGFGSKTYFHITNQNIATIPPTNVIDEIEYNISLKSIVENYSCTAKKAMYLRSVVSARMPSEMDWLKASRKGDRKKRLRILIECSDVTNTSWFFYSRRTVRVILIFFISLNWVEFVHNGRFQIIEVIEGFIL